MTDSSSALAQLAVVASQAAQAQRTSNAALDLVNRARTILGMSPGSVIPVATHVAPYSSPGGGNDPFIAADVSAGVTSVTMEGQPFVSFQRTIKNTAGDASINNITVLGNGFPIESPSAPQTYASSAVINTRGAAITWKFDGVKWQLETTTVAASGIVFPLAIAEGGTGQVSLSGLNMPLAILPSPTTSGISEHTSPSGYSVIDSFVVDFRTTTNAANQSIFGGSFPFTVSSKTPLRIPDNSQVEITLELSAMQEGSPHTAAWKLYQGWWRQGGSAPAALLAAPSAPITTGSDANIPPAGWVNAFAIITGAGPVYDVDIQVATGANINVRWSATLQVKVSKSA